MAAEAPILVAIDDDQVPRDDGWLGPRERAVLAGISHARRRADWRRGRWAAKRAVCRACAELGPDDIEVLAADDGAPEAFVGGRALSLPLSISHSGAVALGAVAPGSTRLGCDVERVEPRSEAFLRDFLLPSERSFVRKGDLQARDERSNLVWSAKESALKAIREGLRRDTRSVEVLAIEELGAERGWHALRVRDAADGRIFAGWWRRRGAMVVTLVADPPGPPPEDEERWEPRSA